MEKPYDEHRWIPAAEALRAISFYLGTATGIENDAANKQAVLLLFDRLASGDLFACPKGLMLPYVTEATDINRWYSLWHTDTIGKKEKYLLETGSDFSHLTIPVEFWRPFQRGTEGAGSDWVAGDFYLDNVCVSRGVWSGRVRDVHFDRLDLPASWLARSQAPICEVEGKLPKENLRPPLDTAKGKLPSNAKNSDRLHESAAHAAAKLVRETKCSCSHAFRQVRNLVEEKNRSEESIESAIRRTFDKMYDARGLVKIDPN